MKKVLSILLCGVLIAAAFAGCSVNGKTENKKLSIVCTVFPIYDWVNNVLGDTKDSAEVTLLLDSGADLHSYQPTADDMIKISGCDVFIYVGGESDEWVENALENASNKEMQALNLMDALGDKTKEEEIIEGMQVEEEESEDGEEEETEYDEHIWLSLKNASFLTDKIAEALSDADAQNKDKYLANAKSFKKSVDELDAEYQKVVDSSKTKTLLFGDRFPFRYMVDDYGLNYYAAFVGCSAETEASFETITFLANKVDELGLTKVMVIESSDKKIANTIIENTKAKNQQVLTLDSMQSTALSEIKSGTTYLGTMKNNLAVLTEALS
ncbi:MAG: zinc ABC transporter substrate-binding protein [Ruminococcaceae bacterium]|nr:zinc ABC transporter substrate-binding protein [Oscillospiraceae bacterium]